MGYKRSAGSNRAFSLDGIPFTIMADANFTQKPSGFENESIATSGSGIMKKTIINRNLEGVVLGTEAADRSLLASIADSTDTVTCSWTNAAGDTFRCTACNINIEGNETETNSTTLTVQVVEPWTESLA